MSPIERLRWAAAPVEQRSLYLMLGCTLAFLAVGALSSLVDLPPLIDAFLALVMLAAWLAGLCGMVGYFRWYFSSKSHEAKGADTKRPKP